MIGLFTHRTLELKKVVLVPNRLMGFLLNSESTKCRQLSLLLQWKSLSFVGFGKFDIQQYEDPASQIEPHLSVRPHHTPETPTNCPGSTKRGGMQIETSKMKGKNTQKKRPKSRKKKIRREKHTNYQTLTRFMIESVIHHQWIIHLQNLKNTKK